MVGIETFVFDLDGTLSDPSDGIIRSANFALESLGFPTAEDHRIRALIGPPLRDTLAELAGPVSDDTLRELIAAYRERYAVSGYAENELYDDIVEVIASLSAQGFRLGICTSKRTDFATRILAMFGLEDYFEFIDGGDIGITKAQQLAVLVENGLEPGTSIMIGDRAVDIQAARQNGIAAAGVLWGFGQASEIASANPEYQVERPTDLLSIV